MVRKMSESARNRIIGYVKKGLSTGDILKKMTAFSRQQVAAVRAWVTMGKY